MTSIRWVGGFFVISMLAYSGCGTLYGADPSRKEASSANTLVTAVEAEPQTQIKPQEASIVLVKAEKEPAPRPEVKVEEVQTEAAEKTEQAAPAPEKEEQEAPVPEKVSNQELLDSALDFCQTSNDYWERGDLDNALDALDKAYSLILKANMDDNPELLQQKEDLRITIAKRIIEVYASRFTVAAGIHKAIPLVMNDHVKRALASLTGREKSFFLYAYRRSGRYRPAIVKALEEAGFPKELSWLPLIESGFSVRALSRARALGLWQFIASTGYKFGLKRDPWIDERMDPDKATQAAIAYLRELHSIFGDWTTVLAAYNCGERAVLNRIRTQKINYLDNFWDLYEKLPQETASYVPRFLAVLHILNDPAAYGIELPPVDAELETEKVPISKQVQLETIAKAMQIDSDVLKQMNPELRLDLTPSSPYELKVPAGTGQILLAKIDEIKPWAPAVASYLVHRVERGDTLSSISMKYRSSVKAIMDLNGLKKSSYLKVGWKLKVPGAGRVLPLATAVSLPKGTSDGKEPVKSAVKKGDSQWKIADQHGTTTKEILARNEVAASNLLEGQVLAIPPDPTTGTTVPAKSYKVRGGDSPYLIAKKHQMTLGEFLKLNNLSPRSTIYPGQTFLVRTE